MIIMNRVKVKSTDEIELPSGENIERQKKMDINTWGCWSMTIKEQEMKDKFMNEISVGQNWFWRLNWMEGIR